MRPKTCAQCGDEYVPRPRATIAMYCGDPCRAAAQRAKAKPVLPRPCGICGTVFQPKPSGVRGKYCGSCKRASRNANERARYAKTEKKERSGPAYISLVCPVCTQTFVSKKSYNAKFCSVKCGNKGRAHYSQPISPINLQIIDLLKAGHNKKYISEFLSVSVNTVAGVMHRNRLGREPNRSKWNPERDAALIKAYTSGNPISQIVTICQAIDGPPLAARNVSDRVARLKIKRPSWYTSNTTHKAMEGVKRRAASRRQSLPSLADLLPPEIPSTEINPPPPNWAPGGAKPPRDLPWDTLCDVAQCEGWFLTSLQDLPSYNKSRIRRGLAPFAVKRENLQQMMPQWR